MERNGNIFTFVIAILGAAKLLANSFNYTFITDDQINAIANFISIGAVGVGIILNHFKPPTTPQDKINNIKY